MTRATRSIRRTRGGDLSAFLAAEDTYARLGMVAPTPGLSWEGMLSEAGMLFGVEAAPLTMSLPDGSTVDLKAHRATYRTDTNAPLGVVGRRYTVQQNTDTILRIGSALEAQGARPMCVGAFGGGARLFGLLAAGDGIEVPGDDSLVQGSLLITSSHDGTLPTQVRSMFWRLSCVNQFDLALFDSLRRFRAKHTRRAPGKVEDYAATLDALAADLAIVSEAANALAAAKFTPEMVDAAASKMFPLPLDGEGKVREDGAMLRRAQDAQETFRYLLAKSPTIGDGMRGTAWGAWNALTEMYDHLLGVTVNPDKRNADPESAFRRTVGGGTTADKAKALRVVADLAGVSVG